MKPKLTSTLLLLVSIVMMAMSPQKMWAQIPHLKVNEPVDVTFSDNSAAYFFTPEKSGYYTITFSSDAVSVNVGEATETFVILSQGSGSTAAHLTAGTKYLVYGTTNTSLSNVTLTVSLTTPDEIIDMEMITLEGTYFANEDIVITQPGYYTFTANQSLLIGVMENDKTLFYGNDGKCAGKLEAGTYTLVCMPTSSVSDLQVTMARDNNAQADEGVEIKELELGDNSITIPVISSYKANFRFTPSQSGYYSFKVSDFTDLSIIVVDDEETVSEEGCLAWSAGAPGEVVVQLTAGTDYYLLVADAGGSAIENVTLTVSTATLLGSAVYNSSAATLTFYSDNVDRSSEGTIFVINGVEAVPAWQDYHSDLCNELRNNVTKVIFDQSFQNARPKMMSRWFKNFSSLTDIEGLSYLNTSEVQSMESTFYACSELATLNLSTFNTAKVTTMEDMFTSCHKLQSITFGDNFTTAKVTNMQAMFAGCKKLASLSLSGFNTSNVTKMYDMFSNCETLQTLDLSGFNTSKVATMEDMFQNCSSLQTLTLGTQFTTSNVITMADMFSGCSALASLDLSNFDTSNLKSMSHMFSRCSALTSLNLSSFNTANVKDMSAIFLGCTNLTSLVIGNLDMRKAGEPESMFVECNKLNNLTVKAIPYLADGTFNSQFSGKRMVDEEEVDVAVTVKYELDDNSQVYVPTEEKPNYLPAPTEAPTYTRNVAAGTQWGTLTLPFPIKSNADYQLYELSAASSDALTFSPVESVEAHKPCLFKKKNSSATSVTFKATEVAALSLSDLDILTLASVNGLSIRGTYSHVYLTDGYFIAQDKFWYAEDETDVYPFRAWFDVINGSNAKSLSIRIAENGGTTAIGSVNSAVNSEQLTVNNGKYLENGNIVIVKNGKKFNVNGQKIR